MLLGSIIASNTLVSPLWAAEATGERAAAETFFYDFADAEIPEDIIIIDANEGPDNNGNPETGEVTWIIDEGSGIDQTPCLYNRTHPGPADDWIVTPLISLNEDYVLTFFARCNASFPDSLEIYASTTGTEEEDFDILVAEGFRVAGTFTRYDFSIVDHPDLNHGDEVYIGIWNYTHGSRIYLDHLGYGPGDPGELIRAYTASEDGMDLLFDGPVGGDALEAENYMLQGTEDITFDAATVNEDNNRLLHLTGASTPIVADLTVDSILNTETGEYIKLYAGITPVAHANINNPDGSLPNDYPATFQAIVMARDGTNRVWLADGDQPRSGVNGYGSEFHDAVEVGDEVLVYGIVSPYLYQTEILAFYGKTLSTDNPLYDPAPINAADISTDNDPDEDPAEMYEGLKVMVQNAEITAYEPPFFIATDDGGTNHFRIGEGFGLFDGVMDEDFLSIGDVYDVTGFVVNRDGPYRVVPRNEQDLQNVTSVEDPFADEVRIYPNPVMHDLTVEASGSQAINVYNASGMLVAEIRNPERMTTIPMDAFKPGVYFVVIEFADGQSKNRKVIRF